MGKTKNNFIRKILKILDIEQVESFALRGKYKWLYSKRLADTEGVRPKGA